jgi:hypothetical protein
MDKLVLSNFENDFSAHLNAIQLVALVSPT